MSFHFFFANKDDFLLNKIRSIFAISSSRKLSSNASYAMRIRRASDDAELDVGFAGNSIDEQAIKDFGGGASDCFVTKWYDQSGNGNHATQTVVTNQPKVYDVATGDLTKENGKPAMVFDGVDDSLILINNGIIATQPNSIATVAARKGGTNSADYFFDGSNGRQILIINQNDYRLFSGLSIISSNSTDTNQHLFLGQFGLTTDKLFIDSIEVASGNAGSNNLGGMVIGASSSNNNHTLDGVIQEIIIFDQNLTTKERTLLHSDINNHFNIY